MWKENFLLHEPFGLKLNTKTTKEVPPLVISWHIGNAFQKYWHFLRGGGYKSMTLIWRSCNDKQIYDIRLDYILYNFNLLCTRRFGWHSL